MESTGGSKGSLQGYMEKEQQYAKQHNGERPDKVSDIFPRTLTIQENVLRVVLGMGKRASGRNRMDDQRKMQQQREPKEGTGRLTSHEYISLEKAILLRGKNNVDIKRRR